MILSNCAITLTPAKLRTKLRERYSGLMPHPNAATLNKVQDYVATTDKPSSTRQQARPSGLEP